MAIFNYIGIDGGGKKTSGVIDAENERAARTKLRKLRIYPTSIKTSGKGGAKLSFGMHRDVGKIFQKIKVRDIATMTGQLATLVASNIPLVDSLAALEDQIENEKLRSMMTSVRERVTEGSKLSDALRAYPKVFNDLYVNMVNAGENSGALDIVLSRLAEFTENQAQLQSKVQGAMIYPIIMGIVGVVLMVVLMTVVVPQITSVLTDFGVELPLPTKILIGLSKGFIKYWYIVAILVAGGVYGVKRYVKTEKGREYKDKKILKLPLFGRLLRMVAISRFSRTLSTLLSSGVPLLAAMDIVRNIVDNVILRRVMDETKNAVKEGASIAEPLRQSGEIPPIVTHMIAIGEKTGQLEKMLEKIADTYDNQVNTTVSSLMTIMEPVMILVMAVVIGFVAIAVMLPLTKMMGAAGM